MRSFSFNIVAVAISSLLASSSYASGFSLYNEVSGANVGDFAARGASGNGDPTDVFYNPAALTLSKGKRLAVSADGVFPSAKFTGQETSPTSTTVSGLQGGDPAVVPSVFFSNSYDAFWSYGIGVYVPFGLATDWPVWGASDSTKSQIRAVTISPAISRKINEKFSVGAALDIQKVDAIFDSAVLLGSDVLLSENDGSAWGYGAHIGFLYQQDAKTRFGLTLQSSIKQSIKGSSSLVVRQTGQVIGYNPNLTADPVDLPSQVTLSGHKEWTDKWTSNVTIAYTHWSLIKMISLNGVTGPVGDNVEVNTPENFRDTWRATFGGEYHYSSKTSFRAGIGFDQTPSNDVDRNLRMPDSDRIGVAVGSRVQYSKSLSFDFGYTHLFMKDASVNDTHEVANSDATTVGTVKSHVDLVALQATWKAV